MEKGSKTPAKTLTDTDIAAERTVGRRSTLAAIGASIAALGIGLGSEPAEAQCTDRDTGRYMDGPGRGHCRRAPPGTRSGCSDSDGGPNADPGGAGRSCGRRSGCSDSDGGPNADPGGAGRSCGGRTSGCSDSDGGPNADPGGNGRSCAGSCTDHDAGRFSDPAGRGRGCRGRGRSCSDTDGGQGADPAGRGRHC